MTIQQMLLVGEFSLVFPAGAWSSTTSLGSATDRGAAAGSLFDTIFAGGVVGATVQATSFRFNGSTFTASGAMTEGRFSHAGCGTATAALMIAGRDVASSAVISRTETYNGSVFAGTGSLTAIRCQHGAAGNNTTALVFGGSSDAATNYKATSELYTSGTWAAGGTMATARRAIAGCGTPTSALAFGGYNGSVSAVTEAYNGSVWSTGGALAAADSGLGAAGGSSTAVFGFGGNNSFAYSAGAWASRPVMVGVTRNQAGGCGNNPTAIAIGGFTGGSSTATCEKYS